MTIGYPDLGIGV
jgi:hypothetical protein